MKLSRILFLSLISMATVASAAAQYQQQPKPPAGHVAQPQSSDSQAEQYPSQPPQQSEQPPQQPPYQPEPSYEPSQPPYQATPRTQGHPPVAGREWVPQGVEALGQYASSRTELTLDHSMLVLASKLDQDNEDLRRVIAGVNGVAVHSFRFPGRVACDPALMGEISQQYREAGWQHLVSKRKREYGGLGTDLWIHMDHAAISDIAVLFVGEKQLNFVSVSGSITPLDLLHLSGHFGIPRMDGGVVVPVPDRNR